MGQILISNKEYFLSKRDYEFLESLRNENGGLKYNISFQISLN